MKFGQLMAYNMRNIFLEILYTEFGEEASPIHFYKKSRLAISVDHQTFVVNA